jgi:hypothetical protein
MFTFILAKSRTEQEEDIHCYQNTNTNVLMSNNPKNNQIIYLKKPNLESS